MVKFLCKNCNYRFESERVFDCPYCGEDSIEKEKTAEELLDEVDRILQN
jgi:predicted RNA-binding Zn-ribbon protein involved in translation (DUF1610 family)